MKPEIHIHFLGFVVVLDKCVGRYPRGKIDDHPAQHVNKRINLEEYCSDNLLVAYASTAYFHGTYLDPTFNPIKAEFVYGISNMIIAPHYELDIKQFMGVSTSQGVDLTRLEVGEPKSKQIKYKGKLVGYEEGASWADIAANPLNTTLENNT